VSGARAAPRAAGAASRLSAADAGEKACRHGTHRAAAPADTVERVRPLMGRMGITRIANVTGLDRIGLPVVMVCRPNSRSVAVSQGKGTDADAARASGLMEAAENWHAERVERPLRIGSARDLRERHALADVQRLPRVRGSRYRDDRTMLWVEGLDLVSGTARWVPYEMVHTDYTLPFPSGSGCFLASTNGLASGNHSLEAVVHGLCELIERDATSVWNALPLAIRGRAWLRLDTVPDPACRAVLERLASAGVAAHVWDISGDAGVASFYCLITDERDRSGQPGAGQGTHPAPEVALLRALTEAAQVRTTYIAGSRDDLTHADYTRAVIDRKLAHARALARSSQGIGRDFRDAPRFDADTFSADVEWLLARLRTIEITEVIAVELGREELGLPVVRMVAPGLEGPDDHPGYAPGARARAAAGDP